MSTKIYNGVKFKSKDWKEVLDQLISVKEKAIQIAFSSIKKRDLELFILSNNLIDKDSYEIVDALKNSNPTRAAFVPRIYFSIILYPTREGDIYGYYFDSDNQKYLDLINPFFDDFHYQNQGDKPDNITDDEWDFRESKWDELVRYKFKDSGFTYDFVTYEDIDSHDIRTIINEILGYLKRDVKIEQIIK